MRDSEDHHVIAMDFVDYRIGKLAHDKTPALLVEPRPTQWGSGNQANAALDFALEVESDLWSAGVIPGKRCCVIFRRARMKYNLSGGYGPAFEPAILRGFQVTRHILFCRRMLSRVPRPCLDLRGLSFHRYL